MATDTTNIQSDVAESFATVHENDIEQIHLTQGASAPVQVQVPAGENVVRVQVTPGETIQLPFPIDAVVARLGENGNLAVKVGDITVILVGYADATAQEEVVIVGTDARPMDVAAVLASTDPNLDIQTAAGPAAGDAGTGVDNNGGLFTPFDPNAGIGGLNAIGGLDPTALNYNLIERQNILYEPEDVVVEADAGPEITTINIAINEDDLSSERGETGPSEFQANAVAGYCELPAQYDGNDEFDGDDSDLNPGGMPDWSKEQTDVIASINVDYGADLPSDPAAAFSLLTLGNVPTSNGEVLILTLSPDGHTILATRPSDEAPIFEVHLVNVDVNGSVVTYDVEFCLINRIDHPEAGESPENQDTWPITVNFDVTDSNGTTGTGHFDVTVKDDVPFIGCPFEGEFLSIQQDGELCVSEANLAGTLNGSFGPLFYGADGPWGAGESGEFEGDNAGDSPATLALQIVDPDGAVDGNGDPVIWASLTFDANGDPVGTSSLKSGGETVLFKQVYDSSSDTLSIIGYLDDGVDNGNDWENASNLVVQITVNVDDANVDWQSGQYEVQVFQPLDHPDAGANGAETGSNDEFVFNLGLTIKDDDGDTATATASFCVNDDGPQIHTTQFPGLVILDETAGNQFGDSDLPGGVSEAQSLFPISALFTPAQYGADGPGSTTFALTTSLGTSFGTAAGTGTPSGLFATSAQSTEIFLFQNGSLVEGRIGNDPAGTLAFTISIVGFDIQVQQWLALKHPTSDPQEAVILGAVAVTATAVDADGDAAIAIAPMEVHFWDDAPDAKDDTDSVGNLQTTDGNVITGDGTTNDPAGDDVAGADGGAAVVSASGSGSGGFQPADGSTTIQGTFGKLVISANGDYTYTRDTSGPLVNSDVFTYLLQDGDSDVDPATLTINIYDEGTELDLPTEGEDGTQVFEKGLPERNVGEPAGSGEIADGNGTDNDDPSEATSGTMNFNTPDGFGSLTIDGVAVTGVIGQTFSGAFGTLVVTGFSSGAGAGSLSYIYTLSDNTSGDATFDDFAVVVTDIDGDATPGTLVVNIVDDEPTANDDADSVGNLQTTDGNVITGAGTTNDPAGDDVVGADDAIVVSASGSGSSGPADGATIIQGTYGKLVISANGDYTYTRDTSGPLIDTDVFTYLLQDGDSDVDPATLTINIYDEGTELDLPTEGEDGTQVFEKGLPERNVGEPAGSGEIADGDGTDNDDPSEATSGTMNFNTPDGFGSLTIDGVAVTGVIGQSFSGAFGTLVVTGFSSGAGAGSLSYIYTLSDNTSGDATFDDFAVVVTDIDGDATPGTLVVNIVDDVPTANDDADSVAAGESTATGNVMTGADTAGGTGGTGVDVEGADGAAVSEVSGVTTDSDGSNGFSVTGLYGTLVMDKFGNYTYTVDPNALVPENAEEVFTYTLTDGDTDTDPATLTISVPQTDLAEGSVTVSGCVAEDNQPGQWSGDETEQREPLIITFTPGDDETVTGATIDIPTGWQLEVWNPNSSTQTALLSAGSGVDISAYIDDVLAGNLQLRPVPPANTDVDGAFTLHLNIEDPDSHQTATLDQAFTVFVDAVADKPTNVTISVEDEGVIQKVQGQDTLIGEGDGHFFKNEEGTVTVTANFNDTDGSESHTVKIDLSNGFLFDADGDGDYESSGSGTFLYNGTTVNWTILNGDLTLTLDPTVGSFTKSFDIKAPNTNGLDVAIETFKVVATADENYQGVSGGGCAPDNTDLDPVNGAFDNQAVTEASASQPNILNGAFITNTNVQKQVALVTFVDKNDPLRAFSQLLVRGSQGQQGAILTDAGFLIDGTHDFLVGVEATAGTKVIITDFSLEGVRIVDPGNAQVEINDEPGGPDSTAIVQSITPATEVGTYQAFESSQDDATGSTAPMTDANAGTAGSAADYVFGGAGDDTITASSGANILNGGDILNAANNGADTITGGSGTDVLVFDALDTLNGGVGFDILRVDEGAIFNTMTAEGLSTVGLGIDATVDLTGKSISNIESILITEEATPNGAGTKVILAAADVLSFTDSSADADGVAADTLYVIGSHGDTLELHLNGETFTTTAINDTTRGMTFTQYNLSNGAHLIVDTDVAVTTI